MGIVTSWEFYNEKTTEFTLFFSEFSVVFFNIIHIHIRGKNEEE